MTFNTCIFHNNSNIVASKTAASVPAGLRGGLTDGKSERREEEKKKEQNGEEEVAMMERRVWEGRRVGRQRALRMRGPLE